MKKTEACRHACLVLQASGPRSETTAGNSRRGAAVKTCPYHLKSDRVACTGAGRPYLPSVGEIESFCCHDGYPLCPILALENGEVRSHFSDEHYWLLGPSHTN